MSTSRSSRFGWTDEDRSTPIELGWCVDAPRARRRRPRLHRPARHRARDRREDVALAPDRPHRRLGRLRPDRTTAAGLIPPKDHTPIHDEYFVYDDDGDPGRLRHQPDVLADAPAPHRPDPRPPGARGTRARRSSSSSTSTTATSTSRRGRPGSRSTTQHERRPDMTTDKRTKKADRKASTAKAEAPATSASDRTYDAIVIGARAQRHGQRRLPGQGRAQDADPRAPAERRRRGDHRGAPAGLLVHDLLVCPEPAAAGDHPRPRADQARLHAAPDVVVVRPDRGRRLPVARPGPRREPQGDRAPQQARRRRLQPVRPRHGDGLPGDQAADRLGAAGPVQRRPGGAAGAGLARLAVPEAWTSGRSTTRSAC